MNRITVKSERWRGRRTNAAGGRRLRPTALVLVLGLLSYDLPVK
jgi:hypothetical protein